MALQSTSSWHGDNFLCKDLLRCSDSYGWDADFSPLQLDTERESHWARQSPAMRWMPSDLSSTSASTSVASSECSDEPYLDIECDSEADSSLFPVSENQTFLSSALLGMLEHSSITDHMSLGTLAWSDSEVETSMSSQMTDDINNNSQDLSPSISSLPQTPRKSSTSAESSLHRKCLWSGMSGADQLKIVEDLTRIISTEMSLREQLEVIQIINPGATISATDTHFAIDLEHLSDDKLEQVRNFVKKHTNNANTLSDSCSECNSPSQKKQTKKQRRSKQRELKQRQRKEQRQMMREKKSGLFVKEEVLSLCTCVPEEELDIDILT